MIKNLNSMFSDFGKYATGYKPIDDDHMAILYNLLRIRDVKDPTYEISLVTDLLLKHFEFEEKIMKEIHYPMIDLHRAVHTEYLIKFQQALVVVSDLTVSDLIADTLNHFIWHDKLLVDYIKQNGLEASVDNFSERVLDNTLC